MVEIKDRVLKVEVTIELKDYFHAYFDAAKTKLIIACLIVAVVIGALTYFFILIGEQKILWQLSLLFFGLPIVVIAAQFLRVHAEFRKYLRDLSATEKHICYMFQENGDGFDIVLGKSFSHVAWENVRQVIERTRHFRFVLNKYESIIIPKRFLLDSSDEALMKKVIVAKMGHKAKLLR